MPTKTTLTREQHWRRTRRLTFTLLAIWFLLTVCVALFARQLLGLELFGWTVSYYMAAQGTILVYLAIIAFYTWRMGKLDRMVGDEHTTRDAHGR